MIELFCKTMNKIGLILEAELSISWTFHKLNLMQMTLNKGFGSLTYELPYEDFGVWT